MTLCPLRAFIYLQIIQSTLTLGRQTVEEAGFRRQTILMYINRESE